MIGFYLHLLAAVARIAKWLFRKLIPSTPAWPIEALPVSVRSLEPRRVLSVNAAFAAGVLDIVIQDDGGSTDAALLNADGTHFFVDTNGDNTYDDGSAGPAELRGLLSQLTHINVTGDNGVGNFFWRDNFSSAVLHASSGNAIEISNLQAAQLAATAEVDGNVSISVSESITLGGSLGIRGNLSAVATSDFGTINGTAGESLNVSGNAHFNANSINLGGAASQQIALGSLTVNSSGSVDITEAGTALDPDTLLVGNNSAGLLRLTSGGNISLAPAANVAVDDFLELNATGTTGSIHVEGLITTANGNLLLHASHSIDLSSSAEVSGSDAANITFVSDSGDIFMEDGAHVTSSGGTIHLTASGTGAGNVTLGSLNAGAGGSIQVIASGNIIDGTADEAANLLATNGSLLLRSLQGSIGTSLDDINIDVQDLIFDAASSTNGLVHISDQANGLRVSGVSQAAAGVILTARSPLTIASNIFLGASSTFTAGNSANPDDDLTIENGAIVTLSSSVAAALVFNAGDSIAFRDGGRIVTTGSNFHLVRLNADQDHAGTGALDGVRGSITQDATTSVEVTTNRLEATAAGPIELDMQVDSLNAISTLAGNIRIYEVDDIQIDRAETNAGAIEVLSDGRIIALNVVASGAGGNVTLHAATGGNSALFFGSIIASENVVFESDMGDIFTGGMVATQGSVTVTAQAGNVLVGFLSAGTHVTITAGGGSILDQNDDTLEDIAAGGSVNLLASGAIGGAGVDQRLEFANRTELSASAGAGAIRIHGVGSLTLTNVATLDGAIDITAAGSVNAWLVDSSASDSDANDVWILTTAGDVAVRTVRAGLLLGDVFIDANGSISDADLAPDDVDIEANDVTLIARNGNIGAIGTSIFKGLPNSLEVVTHAVGGDPLNAGNLVATAMNGAISINATVLGSTSYTTDSLFLQSNGDLDVSALVFAVTNLALIADADGDGFGTLTLGANVSVAGELRIEGANVVSTGAAVPLIDLSAGRLLFKSGGQAEVQVAVDYLDVTSLGDLTIRSILAAVTLVDLDCDNVALQTLGSIGSIDLTSTGTVTVADDVIAGNDGTSASAGSITIQFATGILGDIVIHDLLLTDNGDVNLITSGTIRIGLPAVADAYDDTGADNLASITTINGNIWLQAGASMDGTSITMSDGSTIVAGRSALADYVPGIDGLPSASLIALGVDAKPLGQAQIGLTAIDSIQVASLQSANATSSAIRVVTSLGEIRDGGDSDPDFAASNLGAQVSLEAFHGIGSANALETVVAALDVQNLGTSGDVLVHQLVAGGNLTVHRATNQADFGNVLLQVDGGSLSVASAGLAAAQGNVSLLADNDIDIQASISTTGSGDIYIRANNSLLENLPLPVVDGININATISTENGNIIFDSMHDLRIAAAISSFDGGIGLIAAAEFHQSTTVSTGGDVLARVGGNSTMTAAASVTAANIVSVAGQSVYLGLLSAVSISIEAGGDILDNNGLAVNVRGSQLQMTAIGTIGQSDSANGTPDLNARALDLEVQTVAAASSNGIYLQQSAAGGSLTIGSVVTPSVSVVAHEVGVDGSTSLVTRDGAPVETSGLRTVEGPVKVVVESGGLAIAAGAPGVAGVSAGDANDILLWATADVIVEAEVRSAGGNITVRAGDDIFLNANTNTSGIGDIYLQAGNVVDGDVLGINVDGINLSADIGTEGGSILIDSDQDIAASATITSGSLPLASGASQRGNIGLIATRHVTQTGDIVSSRSALISSGGQFSMDTNATVQAADDLFVRAAESIALNSLLATRVGLETAGSISNNSGPGGVNVVAATLQVVAGSSIGASDIANGQPELNANALNVSVQTLAAMAGDSIYVQQVASGGNLTVGGVGPVVVAVDVLEARFNSTRTSVSAQEELSSRSDLVSAGGPIKVTVRDGSLTIIDGSNGDGAGVTVIGSGDILLSASKDVIVNASVQSGQGNISLIASDDLFVNATIATSGSGSLYLSALDSHNNDAMLSNVDGVNVSVAVIADADILISSQAGILVNADVTSTSGSLGLVAASDVTVAAKLSAAVDILVNTGGVFTQLGGTIIAGSGLSLEALGSIELGFLEGDNVSLSTGGDILDNNGADVLNIRASTLQLRASGGIGASDVANSLDSNDNAIDIEVATLAARGNNGIYLQQLAAGGDLTVGHVAQVSTVAVGQVNFNSTTSPIEVASAASLDDIESTNGPITIVVRGGDLTLDDGADGDELSVVAGGAGDILLAATGNLVSNAGTSSTTGHITLVSLDSVQLNASLTTSGTGSVYVTGRSIDIDAIVSSDRGDILLDAQQTIQNTAVVASTAGSVGIFAGTSALVSANITAGTHVIVSASQDVVQTNSRISAEQTVHISAGRALYLDTITGHTVSLEAGTDIIDNNGAELLNIKSSGLILSAGGMIGDSDLGNLPDLNGNAIDVEVDTLAARSVGGIYVQQLAEGGNLTIDDVVSSASVSISQVRFNSTLSLVETGKLTSGLSDLHADAGPVKLVVQQGSLTVRDGSDASGLGVTAGGNGDILLAALNNIQLAAGVQSATGHISLLATDGLDIGATITTGADGTIFLAGANVRIAGDVSSLSGDILAVADNDLSVQAQITSSLGSVGLQAGNDVLQTTNVVAGESILIAAGNDWTQSGAVATAGQTIIATSGGTSRVDLISAQHISLSAGEDILDNNAQDELNLQAASLRLVAGGIIGGPDSSNSPDSNARALDVEVGTIAAGSDRGIYVQQLAGGGDLRLDHVSGSAALSVNQVRFNSSTSPVLVASSYELDDLSTLAGPIKLVVREGSLAVHDGLNGDGIGVSAGASGDILLAATTDIFSDAAILSESGHISLNAGDDIHINSRISTGGLGSIYLDASNSNLDAAAAIDGIDVRDQLTAVNGSILLSSLQDVRTTAEIASSTASVGIVAARDIVVSANLMAGHDILIEAGRDFTQTAGVATANSVLQINSGGSIQLGEVVGQHVALDAAENILDNNGADVLNVRAQTLRIEAGGIIGGPDTANLPDLNGNAIDLEVSTVAARSANGIYLQQLSSGGNLTIGHVDGAAALAVSKVNFNSTTSLIDRGMISSGVELLALDDLETSSGAIKVAVRGGNLTVTDGSDGDGAGVFALGNHDVLLHASGSAVVDANIRAQVGHISIVAGGLVDIRAGVRNIGQGSVFVQGMNVLVSGNIDSESGNLLFSAVEDIHVGASVLTNTGSVGIVAGRDLLLTASLSAGQDIFVQTGGNATQDVGEFSAGQTVQIVSSGTIRLDRITAKHVALDAAIDILDNNGGDTVNLTADTLRMVAGGIIGGPDSTAALDTNARAIDLAVGTLAARSSTGIYVQQLVGGGDLRIDHVAGSAALAVNQVRFNSTTNIVTVGDIAGSDLRPLDDLETLSGPIKVVVQGGNLVVTEGSDGDGNGVLAGAAGDILLSAVGDVVTFASVLSGTGHISLVAGDDIDVNATITTGGQGSVFLRAGNIGGGDASSGNVDGIDVSQAISTDSGSILLSSQRDIQLSGHISSMVGSVGSIATHDILQNADIRAGQDILLTATADITQAGPTSSIAARTLQMDAGGSVRLASNSAQHVSIAAGQDVLDNNGGDLVNVQANSLRIVAGGTIGQADAGNMQADNNAKAIDLQVVTVAAQSGLGTYLQELSVGADLTVGTVSGSAGLAVVQVRFNSTTTPEIAGSASTGLVALSGLVSEDGPIKVVVRGGSILVDQAIAAGAAGDVLLKAASDVVMQASTASVHGNISLLAERDILTSSSLTTGGSGSVFAVANRDLVLDGVVHTSAGDILLRARRDATITENIQSLTGDMGLIADRDLTLASALNTSGNVIAESGRNLVVDSGTIDAGDKLILAAGRSTANAPLSLGRVQATNVSIEATGDILDGNGQAVNVQAENLRLVADSNQDFVGGIGRHADPLDIEVDVLAARSSQGIYLKQLVAGQDLRIDHVAAINVQIDVEQVNFNSTLLGIREFRSTTNVDDLETLAPRQIGDRAIELEVVRGNLTITDGLDTDQRGLVANSGSILLKTTEAGSIAIQTGIETQGFGGLGNISLDSFGWIAELARDSSGTQSDAKIIGDSLTIHSGQFTHLHHSEVNTLTATVGTNGLLDGIWQQPNRRANDRGDDFLDDLGASRQSSADANGVITEIDRSTNNSRLSAVRESYAEVARQFRFDDTYQRSYALFLQNMKSLDVTTVGAGNINLAVAPNVYIETVGTTANLTVSEAVRTFSSTEQEGGIVLLAGAEFELAGLLSTQSEISLGVSRTQVIQNVGNVSTTDALGQAAIGYLNGRAFQGGEGVSPRDPFLTSTQFVIRDQSFGLSALAEDFRSHVFQRVVLQYGFSGESGFVTFIGYADGEVQQFDVAGESGARTKSFDQTDSSNQGSLPAVLNESGQATGFSRAISFDSSFLDASQMLPTSAIARRAADFFIFENVSAEVAADIRDLTVQSFAVENVSALGAQGATEMPRDADPVRPIEIARNLPTEILVNPTQLIMNSIELEAQPERSVVVAIYRVYYEDTNENGQAELDELPSSNEIIDAQVADEFEADNRQVVELTKGKRIKLGEIKTESGGSPTAEDIEELKNRFLDDPQQPSGAYAIVEKGIDDKETVLDVFSVRDVDSSDLNENLPLIRLPSTELQNQGEKSGDQETAPKPNTDEERVFEGARLEPESNTEQWRSEKSESRFANPGLLLSSVWFAAFVSKRSLLNRQMATGQSEELACLPDLQFDRRARRNRRLQRRHAK